MRDYKSIVIVSEHVPFMGSIIPSLLRICDVAWYQTC